MKGRKLVDFLAYQMKAFHEVKGAIQGKIETTIGSAQGEIKSGMESTIRNNQEKIDAYHKRTEHCQLEIWPK
jgi:hypothetical protein